VPKWVRTAPETWAELAVVVARDWQRRGIGTALLRRVAVHPAAARITDVTALVSGSNGQVLALVDELAVQHSVSYDHCNGTLRAHLPTCACDTAVVPGGHASAWES
jgi:GNAT superfamily N-acetyltransferase